MGHTTLNAPMRIKQAREELGLTQQQVGEYLRIRRAAVSDIENGKRDISLAEAVKLCRLFNVKLWWLATGQNEQPKHFRQ